MTPPFESLAVMGRLRMVLGQIRYLRVKSAIVLNDAEGTVSVSACSRLSCKGTMIDVGRLFRGLVMVPDDQVSETWSEDSSGFVFRFNLLKKSGVHVKGTVYVLAHP